MGSSVKNLFLLKYLSWKDKLLTPNKGPPLFQSTTILSKDCCWNYIYTRTWRWNHPLKLKEIMERERVFQFLVGLNLECDKASRQVIGGEPFSSLDEAFAHVWGEESCKELMVGNFRNPIPENSALAVSKPLSITWNYKGEGKRMVDNEIVWYAHCHKPRHTREVYWKLHRNLKIWRELSTKEDTTWQNLDKSTKQLF